jgi:RNA polymerase sigma factor (sigma-70 family)
VSDGCLLDVFIAQRDEAAFEALVRRHGPMVVGVCQRVLCNEHDAEDAFQATFLVLVRKAASVRPREMVGNWLYGVAYRTSLEAKKAVAKRRLKEAEVMLRTEAPEQTQTDLRPVLDRELAALPHKYRVPLVLCELDGRSRKEVARQLDVPEGTVASRVARAKNMLAKRLARRGFGGGSVATVLAQTVALAHVPTPLMVSTVTAATAVAAGQTAVAGVISARVAALTEGVLKAMLLTKLKIAMALMLGVVIVAAGGNMLAHQAPGDKQTGVSRAEVPQRSPQNSGKRKAPRTWKGQMTLEADLKLIYAVVFSPDGTTVAAVDGSVKLWDVATGKHRATFKAKEPEDEVIPVSFSPDGSTLAGAIAQKREGKYVAGSDSEVKLWNWHTGQELGALRCKKLVRSVAFSPDGKILASAGRVVQFWDMATRRERSTLDTWADRLVFAPNGKTLATVHLLPRYAGEVKLWDVASGKQLATLEHQNGPARIAFAPDGKTLATAAYIDVKLWDVATAKELASLKAEGEGQLLAEQFESVAFSPDGKTLAVGAGSPGPRTPDFGHVALWDVATRERRMTLEAHPKRLSSVAFAPDGKILATASYDKTVKLWEVEPLISQKKEKDE